MSSAFFPFGEGPPPRGPMRHQRVAWELHPILTAVLNRLADTSLGPAFKDRAAEVSMSKVLSAPVDRAAALAAHLWVLNHAEGNGLTLTAAGYLRPADVKGLAAVMPEMQDWIFNVGREIDTHPVLYFREYLKEIGLLRKYKGTLRLSRLGRAALTDVDVLWEHLAQTLIPAATDFDTFAIVVVLVHAATSEGEPDLDTIARTMGALGWKLQDGSPITRSHIYPAWNEIWTALSNVGERVVISGPNRRVLSQPARLLINEALFTEVDPPPEP